MVLRFSKLGGLSAWTHSEEHLQQKTLHGAIGEWAHCWAAANASLRAPCTGGR